VSHITLWTESRLHTDYGHLNLLLLLADMVYMCAVIAEDGTACLSDFGYTRKLGQCDMDETHANYSSSVGTWNDLVASTLAVSVLCGRFGGDSWSHEHPQPCLKITFV